jgi:hypothetical protein
VVDRRLVAVERRMSLNAIERIAIVSEERKRRVFMRRVYRRERMEWKEREGKNRFKGLSLDNALISIGWEG